MVQATKPKMVYSAKPLPITGGYQNLVLVSHEEAQHQVDSLKAMGASFTGTKLAKAIILLQNPHQVSAKEYETMSVSDFMK